ncbi:hypothetical protein I6F37_04170 [Bradyrhizobium sp. NBAIM08]|nr:hypothetical protein [Bradyrhizobium sp. NBAIM08]
MPKKIATCTSCPVEIPGEVILNAALAMAGLRSDVHGLSVMACKFEGGTATILSKLAEMRDIDP